MLHMRTTWSLFCPRTLVCSEPLCMQVAGHMASANKGGGTFLDAEGRLHKATKLDDRSDREWAFYLCVTQCRSVASAESGPVVSAEAGQDDAAAGAREQEEGTHLPGNSVRCAAQDCARAVSLAAGLSGLPACRCQQAGPALWFVGPGTPANNCCMAASPCAPTRGWDAKLCPQLAMVPLPGDMLISLNS